MVNQAADESPKEHILLRIPLHVRGGIEIRGQLTAPFWILAVPENDQGAFQGNRFQQGSQAIPVGAIGTPGIEEE
jgi:hypothetical protein